MTRKGALMLGRHQVAALVATAVDFATMIALVELAGARAPVATAVGACSGAVTNFALGRTWAFGARDGAIGPQAARYAVVSSASAAWNAFGEWLAHDVANVPYVLARACVALVVSLAWNYPMQRWFVFRHRSEATS
jgi:putative flippase GtrA